jgi:cytoskeletal protein CcmA (bactofilin family)
MTVTKTLSEGLLTNVRDSIVIGKKSMQSNQGSIESKKLIVGKDITLKGAIEECASLIVEGTVEATLEGGSFLEVSETGIFRGKAIVEEIVISGLFDGDLFASKKLTIKSTGRVEGNISYGAIEIELGGQINGNTKQTDKKEI